MPARDQDSRRRRSDRSKSAKDSAQDRSFDDIDAEEIELEEERDDKSLRSKLEAMVPEVVKRAMVSGLGALFVTEETIRSAVGEMRLPKEAVNFMVQQADNTKEQLFRHIARELREVLEKANLAEDLPKMLANMTVEVTTQIRFMPNEQSQADDPPLKTQTRSEVEVTSRRKRDR